MKKLYPWKYVDRPRSDAELEQEVDRIFSMYCTLDTTSYNVEVDEKVRSISVHLLCIRDSLAPSSCPPGVSACCAELPPLVMAAKLQSFMKLAKDAKIVDNKITITRLNLMFLGVRARLPVLISPCLSRSMLSSCSISVGPECPSDAIGLGLVLIIVTDRQRGAESGSPGPRHPANEAARSREDGVSGSAEEVGRNLGVGLGCGHEPDTPATPGNSGIDSLQ